MSELGDSKICAYQATERLRERNIRQEDDIQLFAAFEKSEESGEFYRQQAEFWAGECIAEQKKAHYALFFSIVGFAVAFVAIGKAILSCQ